jgi:hypothetical protein
VADEHQVHVVGWPPEPVRLEHHFSPEEDYPLSVSFEDSPARVILSTPGGNALGVNMNMLLRALDTLPVCISPCEPICAESDYRIRISVFDHPVITIRVRGITRLFGPGEEL